MVNNRVRLQCNTDMPTGIIIAVIGAVAAVATSFFTASATSAARVNDVNTQVQVLQERQNLQYTELKGTLDRIEKKLDTLETIPKKP